MKTTKYMGLALSLAAASVLTLTGCGGSSSSTPPAEAVAYNGVFVDSPVAGVNFECGTVSDITDADGKFGTCPAGSTVTFSIGDMVLGSSSATGDGVFFVTDIVEGASRDDIDNVEVLKIAVLLQSLDSDGDPSNGIDVPAEAATLLPSGTVADLTAEETVALAAETVGELEATYPDMEYVTSAEAEANLADTLEVIDTFEPDVVTGSEGGS